MLTDKYDTSSLRRKRGLLVVRGESVDGSTEAAYRRLKVEGGKKEVMIGGRSL